jgi:pimeloyl-ACP methyl ester carboxylesterase
MGRIQMPVVERADTKVHYRLHGAGFPLVLLHGHPLTGDSWGLAGYLDVLTKRYACITIDARGAGGSGKPVLPAHHALDLYVGDVLAVLDQEQIDSFAVWGFSRGGAVCLALAAACPERVRCVLSTGAFDLRPETLEDIEDGRGIVEKTRTGGMPAMLADWEPDEDPPLPDWFRRMILNYDPRAWMAARYASGCWPEIPAERIAAPTLVIVGSREDPNGDATRWVTRLARGRCTTLAERTHCGAFLATHESLAVALPFLGLAV